MDNGGLFTERLFKQAAIPLGARALDVGCGRGDVTMRLAGAVGARGQVLGIDLDANALEFAKQRAEDEGAAHVSFEKRDLCSLPEDGSQFDVITCRRVLMYLPQQVEAVKLLRTMLLPGGLLVVQEHDASLLRSSAPLPLFEKARAWIWDTVRAEGGNTSTGFDLYGLLAEAGFSEIVISSEAVVETPMQPGQIAAIVKIMVPRIEAAGIATAGEINADTLDRRLADERRAVAATSVGELIFGAIALV